MRFGFLYAVALLLPSFVVRAQQGVPQISVDSGYAAQQMTVVPIMHSSLRDTVYAEQLTQGSDRGMTSHQRRQWRAERYKFYVDSLVQSRDYVFRPESMQNAAGGVLQMIYAEYFYFGMFTDTVEVHLPMQSVDNYVTISNFDSAISSYTEQLTAEGVWNIGFNLKNQGVVWGAHLAISDITGHVTLTLATPNMTMLYYGTISPRRYGYLMRSREGYQKSRGSR